MPERTGVPVIRIPSVLWIVLACILPASCATSQQSQDANTAITSAQAGAPGLGDALYPELGNGGYDALHYDLELGVNLEDNHIFGKATIDARALHDLTAFNLDFVGLEVHSIRLDGEDVNFTRAEREMTITPTETIQAGTRFQVVVAYEGNPSGVPDPGVPFIPAVGWMYSEEGVAVASETSGSAGWFPVNDHPLDKATYAMHITVPHPYVVAANGILKKVDERGTAGEAGAARTYHWEAGDPMASYLVTMNIAEFDEDRSTGPDGLPIHDFFFKGLDEKRRAAYAVQAEMLEFFSGIFGPYPFESCGAVVVPHPLPGALETQTRAVYGRRVSGQGVIAHELTHQWYGNSIGLRQWSDIWLSEGFASYGSWLWREHKSGREVLDKQAAQAYKQLALREVGAPATPTHKSLFGMSSYTRGAWTLHALRLEVGDEAFFETLRTYSKRFRHGHATTPDFIAVAEELSGQELDAFFQGWLYDDELPDVPELELSASAIREERARRDREPRAAGSDAKGGN